MISPAASIPTLLLTVFLTLGLLSPPASAQEGFVRPDADRLATIFATFEREAQSAMADFGVPGMAVAVVRDGAIIYKKAFGVKKSGENDPVTENTVFQIGSTSKAFTAALVGMLVDEKKVGWEDRVVDHLPGFRLYDPWVTREFSITDLMAHRSGLPEHAGDILGVLGYDRTQIRNSIRFIKPVSSFRSQFAYQNTMYLVAAELAEKYWGGTWEDLVRERIFKPLGMTNSSADAKGFKEAADACCLHRMADGKVISFTVDRMPFDCYAFGPAGGINSTVIDMSRWLMPHMGGGAYQGVRLLSEPSMAYLITPKTIISAAGTISGNTYYCLGWGYKEDTPSPLIMHSGDPVGCRSVVLFAPKAGVGIVLLSNLGGVPVPEALSKTFFELYYGRPLTEWKEGVKTALEAARQTDRKQPENPSPSLPPATYAGAYKNEVYGELSVFEKAGSLALAIGPKKMELSLKHWDRDVFQLFDPETGEKGGMVAFQTGPGGGKPSTLAIDSLNKDGCGVFERVKE